MVDREYSSAQLGKGRFMGLLDLLNRHRGKGQQKKGPVLGGEVHLNS